MGKLKRSEYRKGQQIEETEPTFKKFFLPKGYFEKLADQIRQRKQRGESFKEYMIDLQSLMKLSEKTTKEVIECLVQNCMQKMFIKSYACTS